MGMGTVLKDLSNRPMGYVRLSEGNVCCRISQTACTQLAVCFADGTRVLYTLDGSTQEQRFSCAGKQLRGCYAFDKDELLLISGEEMRAEFFRHKPQPVKMQANEDVHQIRAGSSLEKLPAAQTTCAAIHVMAQRRWPPPPCWDTAYYRNGGWQEDEKRRV